MESKVIFLQGGLANQLFQYAFGKYIIKNYGYTVKFNTSILSKFRKKIEPRKFEIRNILHPNSISHSYIDLLKFFIRNKNNSLINSFYIENNLNEFPIGNIIERKKYFSGYFQNYNYIDDIWQLEKDNLSKLFERRLVKHKDYITIHVRLGDYRTNLIANKFHGTLPVNYYIRSLEKLLDLTNIRTIQIVSDEVSIAKEYFKKFEKTLQILHDPSNDHFKDLNLLANSKGVIMSNSSFSWWGAYFAHQNNGASIIVPDRWFLSDEVEQPTYLIKPNWITSSRLG